MFGSPAAEIPGVRAVYRLAVAGQLQGAEANATAGLRAGDRVRVDGLAGFRWLGLGEELTFTGTGYGLPDSVFPGPLTDFVDRFRGRNDFYGGQVGVRAECGTGRLTVGATAKVALGVNHERADLGGAVTTPSGTLFLSTKGTTGQIYPGGVFTQPSNLGTRQRDVFAAAPEVRVNVRWAVTTRLRLTAGYTFLGLSDVARPGDMVDPSVNLTRTNLAALSRATVGTGPSPIPFGQPQGAPAAAGPAAPAFRFPGTTFWAQGLDFGLALAY